MGSIGDCLENAVIESFRGRMQTELLDGQRWKIGVGLANAMFDYLEIFHNRQAATYRSGCSPRSITRTFTTTDPSHDRIKSNRPR